MISGSSCSSSWLFYIVAITGKKHEVELDLGGMGGGGSVRLEVISWRLDCSVQIRQDMHE